MKKIIAISFLFIFLCANTEMYQLLKLPVLIHHFIEHLEEDSAETLAEFIDEHYSERQHHSENHKHEHENLPFKTIDFAAAHVLLANENHNPYSLIKPTVFHKKSSPIYMGDFYSFTGVSNIWQPPKIS